MTPYRWRHTFGRERWQVALLIHAAKASEPIALHRVAELECPHRVKSKAGVLGKLGRAMRELVADHLARYVLVPSTFPRGKRKLNGIEITPEGRALVERWGTRTRPPLLPSERSEF